ncbi:MAG: orotidine-5'-phosphate decarboxylase [Candidatus Mycalebacterium zealandia]|nr:MAG: orotidine-5'-phosphate decarboxylase [Candidatus Mycalebacterium zealandia]
MSAVKNRLILALDFPSIHMAQSFALGSIGRVGAYKVGPVMFLAEGPKVIGWLQDKCGGGIFLDLKFHDIPNTVAGTVSRISHLNVDMFTVHSLGGTKMVKAARDTAAEGAEKLNLPRPKVVAVTVLTSHDEEEAKKLFGATDTVSAVLRLAEAAEKGGADGLVCSGNEIEPLKKEFGDRFKLIVPGVRLPGADVGDQKRTVTPKEAIEKGADFLVIGRTITQSDDPVKTLDEIAASIA